MISASLVVDRPSHGLGLPPHHHTHHHHHHHPNAHMTFDSSFLLPPKPCSPPEFLRPLPKPAPILQQQQQQQQQRYNGVATTTAHSSAQHHPPSSLNGCRVVTHSLAPRVSTSASKYHEHNNNPVAVNLVKDAADAPEESPFTTPSSYRFPTQPYYPGPYGTLYPNHYNPLMARALFPPADTFRHQSPPAPASPQFLSPPTPTFSPPQTSVKPGQSILLKRTFKVPSGKEGSLKHRILTRPSEANSPKKRVIPPPNFTKGSLIQLSNGDLKRVEDMRTEDFVSSAEKSQALRLDPSTVVRIEESQGNVLLTLSYGEHKSQVDFESSVDHPFFVFGHGWSSYSPERSLQQYGLKCHRLQVGDICISLTPRSPPSKPGDATLPRKRRWSAPEQCPDDDEEPPKKT